jgi:tetratricopeptide (TPR) repeat protein
MVGWTKGHWTIVQWKCGLDWEHSRSAGDRGFETLRAVTLAGITAFLLLSLAIGTDSFAGANDGQVCDVDADYSLGVEDYSETIRRHVEVVRQHPDNAIAHYHLGFAQGMGGDRRAEIREYQRAQALGLRSWDLFLNKGLAQLEDGDLDAAVESIRLAARLGGDHFEAHFELARLDERIGMLAEAEHETLASLLLSPEHPEARNLLGVIYAEQGHTARAYSIWRELVQELPDYEPALINLSLLDSATPAASGERAAADRPMFHQTHQHLERTTLRLR